MARRVILFGLSANPPTGLGGHAGIVRWAATEAGADEVWVLPVYRHAYASKTHMPSYAHRRAMAKLAFESIEGCEGRVFVRDTEREVFETTLEEARARGEPEEHARIGTIDVVRRLHVDHPDAGLSLLLGGDTYRDLMAGKWRESDALVKLVPIIVIARAGASTGAQGEIVIPGLTDISSSAVRRSSDLEFLGRALQPQVLDYIRGHRLYAFAECEAATT